MKEIDKFLDWLVSLDIAHYSTDKTRPFGSPTYTPSGPSHFYLKGSQERFTSKEMISIFENVATDETNENWQYAIAEHGKWKAKNS